LVLAANTINITSGNLKPIEPVLIVVFKGKSPQRHLTPNDYEAAHVQM